MRLNRMTAAIPLLFVISLHAESNEGDLLEPRKRSAEKTRTGLGDSAADFWIYDDLKAGEAKSARTGKPLLVSFR